MKYQPEIGDKIFEILKTDIELQNIINNSEELKKEHKPKKKYGNCPLSTSESIAFKCFWNGVEGKKLKIVFRLKYEDKLPYNNSTISKLKDYVRIYSRHGIDGLERFRNLGR